MSPGGSRGVSGGVTGDRWPPGLRTRRRERLRPGGRRGQGGRARTGKIRGERAELRVSPSLDRSRPLLWSWSSETNACPSCQETAAFKPAATSTSLVPSPALARPSPRAPPTPTARRPARCRHRPGAWERAPAPDTGAGVLAPGGQRADPRREREPPIGWLEWRRRALG